MSTVIIVAGVNEAPYIQENAEYIGVDYGVKICVDNGITPVIGIGDFDSLDISQYPNIPIIKYQSEKDETDLELAVEYALSRYDKIIVSNALGGRIDHELFNLKLLQKYPQMRFISEKQEAFILSKGVHIIENIKYYFSFFPLEDTIITLSGFKYPLTNAFMTTKEFKTISNEILGDSATIEIHLGSILCIQCE